MYTVDVKVRGVAPLLQHRYPMPDFATMGKGSRKQTGSVDYSEEWRQYMYVNSSGGIFQPATHFESSMIAAAVNFKIQGKRGKTFKDLFKACIFVSPDEILFGIQQPEQLDTDADKELYLDLRPVVVNRARVVRVRPAFKAGWELEFTIECIDDGINSDTLQDVLTLAGKSVGVGDYRPRFGRFSVSKFEVNR